MTDRRIFPYFHPTTTVFVDDNPDFLRSLVLHLPDELAFQLYSNPEHALERINRKPTQPHLYDRCFSQYRNISLRDDAQRLIHLDLNLIELEVSNPDRFHEVSVVVVDYDMPSMNGLDFIRGMTDSHVKKVLLTGVADEKVAVRAFNDGLIDRFIRKQEPDAIRTLVRTIHELQRTYFADVSQMLLNSLLLQSPSFLADPAFEELFEQLRERFSICEYYLVENPSGLLIMQADGSIKRLMVASREDLARQVTQGRRIGAPARYLDEVAAGRMIAYFYDPFDDLFDPEACDWEEYFFPARPLAGEFAHCYAVLDDPPVDIEFDADTAAYQAYLGTLDAGIER